MTPLTIQAMRWWLDGKEVQVRQPGDDWSLVLPASHDNGAYVRFFDEYEYRIKPSTIRIGGYDVPEPVREPLQVGDEYYTPSIGVNGVGVVAMEWIGEVDDYDRLTCGLIHLTIDSAEMHTKAIVSFTKGE